MKKIVYILILLTLLTGCNNQSSEIESALTEIKSVNDEVETLKSKIQKMDKVVTAQANRIGELESKKADKVDLERVLSKIENESAFLSVDATGYSILNNSHGAFIIFVENAESYLDGYKVTVNIGNLTGGTYENYKLHFVFPPQLKLSEILEGSVTTINAYNYLDHKYITHSELSKMNKGSWNTITANLSNIKLEELKGFYVVLEISSVYLSN